MCKRSEVGLVVTFSVYRREVRDYLRLLMPVTWTSPVYHLIHKMSACSWFCHRLMLTLDEQRGMMILLIYVRIYFAVDHALKPIGGMKPLLSQLTGNISFNLWHHPKTPNFHHEPWDVAYYKSTTWEKCSWTLGYSLFIYQLVGFGLRILGLHPLQSEDLTILRLDCDPEVVRMGTGI